MTSSKRGRPRASGERFPGGKLKPQLEPMSGVMWQRMQANARAAAIDERFLTELGRLNACGELSVAQTVAGHRIAEIYGRFERLKGIGRSARSPSYQSTFGEAGASEDFLTAEAKAELEDRRRGVIEAFQTLMTEIPANLRSTLEELCVEDRSIGYARYEEVRVVLDRLGTLWKISGAKKRGGPSPSRPGYRTAQSATPAAPPAPNLDRIFWMQIIAKMRPDLSTTEVGAVYDLQQALKQREGFRRGKARRRI